MDQEIQIFINKLRKRLWVQKTIRLVPFFLSIGCFIAFFHVLFGFFRPFYYAGTIGLFWILISFFIGSLYLVLHFPKEQEAAHTGDSIIGQERLLTALELRGNEGAIACLQKKDTIAHMSFNVKEAFPYRLPPKQSLACLLAVSLFLLFFFLPSGAKQTAQKLHEIKQEAKTEAALLENVKKELKKEAKSIEESTEDSSVIPKTVGEKLAAYGKSEKIGQLLEQAEKEYSSANSKQDLRKAKERLQVKLENMAANAASSDEQKAISDLMKRAGFSSYNSNNNNSTAGGQTENSNADNTGTDTANNTNDNNNNSPNNNDNNTNADNTNNSSDNSDNSNSNNNNSSNNNGNSDNSSSNNSSNSNNNNNSNNNSNSKNNDDNNDNNNNDSNNNSNNNNNDNSDNNNNSNNTSNGSNSDDNTSAKNSGNGKNKDNSQNGGGKNQGSKKGIERKIKISEPKEKVMIVEDAAEDNKNTVSSSKKDGNSHQETSDQQLAFGTKKDVEDVVGDYAESAFTAIDNNSIPAFMADVVSIYFSQIQ